MNKRLAILFLLTPFMIFAAAKDAAKKKTLKVEFEVVYSLSERYVDPFMIEVYSVTDSSKVAQERRMWRDGAGRLILEAGKIYKATVYPVSFDYVSEEDGSLLAHPDYEPVIIDIDLRDVTKNLKLDQVRIRKKMHRQLDEATVTSSRILFYHKGDTLVYNASEFVLAEGSMIDALIKQLPGVTLKDNGEIFVNGRKVDDLLLNGKDLFNGNHQLMLENIGAYTVKDIAVYEKNTLVNEMLGRDDKHEKRYSMDVRLKRQYSTGWNINAEAGYGTRDRYLGKLFAMLFSDNLNLNVRAGINNLSSPFINNDAWTPPMVQSGVKTTKTAGISYSVDGHANKWRTSGWVDVSHVDDHADVTTVTENFLPDGNNYLYQFSNSLSRRLTVNTNHDFMFSIPQKVVFNASPRFYYERNKADGSNVSALFSDEVQNVTSERIRNIYRGYTGLADTLIYRNISQNVIDGHSSSSLLMTDATFNIRSNKLRFTFLGSYDTKKENIFQLYLINHATEPTPSTQDFQHRDISPDHTRKLKGLTEFFVDLDWAESRIGFNYSFENISTVNTSNVSDAADWDLSADAAATTIADIQALPGFAPVFSPALSHSSRLRTDTHHLWAFFSHIHPIRLSDDYTLNTHLTPLDLSFSERTYHYDSNDTPVLLKRKSFLPKADAFVSLYNKKNMARLTLNYTLDSRDAPMQSMVSLPRTDPMNVYIGNPDLKRSVNHIARLMYGIMKGQKYHNFTISAKFMSNAVASGYIFNTATGVRYYHPFNVSGNWEGGATYGFYIPFGAGNRFQLQSHTSGSYVNSVDLIGTSVVTEDFMFDPAEQKRRYVKDMSVEENLEFSYTFGSNCVSAKGEVRLNDYRSKDSGFSNFTSTTARYGVSGVFALPAGFGISTDLNVYTRRGFTDSRLNTSDVVWNARLTKSLMKGSMILAVDAYDMLRQLSNITYTVNAQARTEVVTNVIPAYVLFHIQYRFNHAPKK